MIKDALRRDVAVEFLTQSDLPLLEVAARVGFSEASTFLKHFDETGLHATHDEVMAWMRIWGTDKESATPVRHP